VWERELSYDACVCVASVGERESSAMNRQAINDQRRQACSAN